ncbi:MAG: alpha/beta fold hydrolase [Anaerolineae bacterium]|nr:alpha/beta fold hydrolase [Anaerolineae bacterium]
MATVVLPETTRALYPFKSHFLTLSDSKRMHYIDEGPKDGETLVFVHGYPTWSFLYRALVVYYAARGFRCVAMDHIGYGLSDKPPGKNYHSMRQHIHNLLDCLSMLELQDVTLVMQDWGTPLALGYAIRRAANVRRLVIMGSWVFQETLPHRLHPLVKWATTPGLGDLLFNMLGLSVGLWLQTGTTRRLSPLVMAGYKAPFPDSRSRKALIQFPRMISTTLTHPSAPLMIEIERGLDTLQHIPTLIIWGKADPFFTPDIAYHWKALMPHARGPVLLDAGHFLLEDDPEAVIHYLDDFFAATITRPDPE